MEEKISDTNKGTENIIKSSIMDKIEQPKALFEELLNVQREDNKVLYQCVYDLNHIHNIDVCLFGVQAINDGLSCWDVLHILKDAIPDLNHNVDSMIQLLEKFHLGMKNDMAAGQQYVPIEKLAQKQPQFARCLLDKLVANPASFCVIYISIILCELSEQNKGDIHCELLLLANNESIYIVQAAINTLGRLNYQIPNDLEILEKTLEVLNKLSNKKSEDIDVAIAQAFGNLANISEKAQKGLVNYVKQDNPQIHSQVSIALFRNCENSHQSQWFKECLIELAKTSCLHKGIFNYLDMILHKYLQNDQDWDYVENFLLEWSLKSDIYKKPNEKIDKLFHSSLCLLMNNKENMEKLVTNFLNHEDHKVHHVLSLVVRAISVHEITNLDLNITIIDSLEFVDILYISRKILGYVHEPDLLCSLIFSILEKKVIDEQLEGLVIDIFCNFIGKDYPEKGLKFLKKRNYAKDGNGIKEKVSKIIINNIEEYQNILKELPQLKELSPPRQQSYQIAIEINKNIKKTMEQAEKGSIVDLLTTKVPLKYGKAWFSYTQGKYDKPRPLLPSSFLIERPRSEITHPVTKEVERVNYRIVKRGEI